MEGLGGKLLIKNRKERSNNEELMSYPPQEQKTKGLTVILKFPLIVPGSSFVDGNIQEDHMSPMMKSHRNEENLADSLESLSNSFSDDQT